MAKIKEFEFGDYTLVYNFDALETAEDKLGPLAALLTDPVRAAQMKTIRILFWAGLLAKHQIAIEDIGPIIDEIGITEVSNAIQGAMQKAYPTPEANDSGKQKAV